MKKFVCLVIYFAFLYSSSSFSSYSGELSISHEVLNQLFEEYLSKLNLDSIIWIAKKKIDDETLKSDTKIVDLIKTFLFEGALRRLACCFLFLSTEERYNTEIWFQGEVESVSEGLVAEYIKKENELKREKQFYSENKKNLVEKIIRAHCCGFFHDIDQLAKQFYHSIDENLSVKRVARKE